MGGLDDTDLLMDKSNSIFNCIFHEHLTVVICLFFDIDGLYVPFANLLHPSRNMSVSFSAVPLWKSLSNPFSLCTACSMDRFR